MSVQDAACGVRDWLVHIVTFYQHCEKPCNGSSLKCTRPLNDFWKDSENRWRVSLLARRFTSGQPDLSLSHREPCDRVHNQQNILALVPKILGHCERDKARPHAQRRRAIRGCNHNHRPLPAFGSKLVFQKFAHFPVAFAYESDHCDIGRTLCRHCTKQRTLSNSTSPEDANPLPKPTRKKGIYRPDAGYQRRVDVLTFERTGRRGKQAITGNSLERRAPVDEPAEAVQNAPE